MLGIRYPLLTAAVHRIRIISVLTVFILLCLGGVLSSQAYAANIYTDRPDYPPGDSVVITGSGFWSGETVRLSVIHVDGVTPMTPDYDPWDISANGYGNFETRWIVPEDALGQTLMVTAVGQSSGIMASATFTDNSTTLVFSYDYGTFCPGTPVDVCAELYENCCGGSHAPLAGRPVIFFVNEGNCGVNVGQNAEDTVYTDVNGVACATLTVPAVGTYSFRAKFLGEPKPGHSDPPNGACDPTKRVNLSASNACDEVIGSYDACNAPPTATCPGNQSLFVCDLSEICISGFSCDDPDGNLVSCETTLGTYSGGEVCFTPTGAGDYTIKLIATDSHGLADTCQTIVSVALNNAPVCNLPSDNSYFVCGDTTFSFPVSATDVDGNLTGCVKTSGPGTLSGGMWTFTTTAPGVYTATFTCTDVCGASCTGTVNITVAYNQAPVATCPGNQSLFVCDLSPITLSGFSCDDADGNLATCSVDNGTLSGDEVTFTPVVGVNTITLTATDECGATHSCQTQITVALNNAPVCNLPSDNSYFVCGDTTFSFPVSATDVDGNLTGCVKTSGPGTLSGGMWTFTTTAPGVYTATFTCTDVCGASCTGTVNITVGYNQAPVASCPGNQSLFVCDLSPITISGFSCDDADGNLATCSVDNGTLSGDQVTFTPVVGVNTITLTATDECGATHSCQTQITVGLNNPPVCNLPSDNSYFVCGDTTFSFPVSATDPDGNLSGCVKTSGPGTLSGGMWTFTTTGPGVYTATFTCTDVCGASCTGTVNITVGYNQAPVASCPGNQSLFVCDLSPITLSGFSCDDADGNLATCSVDNGTLSGDEVTFTPIVGVNTITLTATDDCGATHSCQTQITVALNNPPVCNLPTPGTYFVSGDTTFSFPVSATDPDGNLVGCTMLSGIGTFDGSTWTFTTSGPGSYTATFECADECGETCGGTTGGGTITMIVGYNQPPTATCPGNQSLFVCDLSEICISGFSCDDPDGNLASCETTLGTYSGGEVCFTPTGAGDYTIKLIATDSDGLADTCQTIVSVALNSAPVCNLPARCDYFVCGDTTFRFPVSATDPDGNLTGCVKTSGPGTLSGGMWTFTTTGPGVYTAEFTCTDDCGAFCSGSATVTVAYNQPPVVNCPNDTSINFLCEASEICYGSGFTSSDPDNNIVSETVSFGTLSGGSVCFTPDTAGVYEILYTVTDACGESAQCVSHVTVSYTNQPPVASCPGDTTVSFACELSEICVGPFSATDPDNNIASETVSLGTLSGGTVCFTPTATGTYDIVHTVTDDCGLVAVCTTTVTVEVSNSPPPVSCPGDTTITLCDLGDICIGPFECSDPDGNLATCEVVGYTLDNGNVCFTPTEGENVLTLIATDECGLVDSCKTTVTVNIVPPLEISGNTTFSVVTCEPGEFCVPLPDVTGGLAPITWTFEGRPVVDTVCFYLPDDTVITGQLIATDDCEHSVTATLTVDATVNTVPVVTADAPASMSLCEPDTVCVKLTIVDPDDGLIGVSLIGTLDLSDSTVCFFADTSGHYCDQVTIMDSCGASGTDDYCIDIQINRDPVCSLPGDESIVSCAPMQVCRDVSATDPDGNLVGCEVVAGPGSIINGQWCYTFDGDMSVTPTIRCTDECGAACEGSFTIDFDLNEGPTAQCPGYVHQTMSTLEEICIPGFSCSDPDDNLTDCRIEGIAGSLVGDQLCFTPEWGDNHVYLIAEDACGLADTCETIVNVSPPMAQCPIVRIEKTHGSMQGHFETVSITIESPNIQMGGFDFLIAYDASALAFSEAAVGQLLEDCGWEYFTYRHGVEGNCGDACPSGLLRIVALAETNNGASHPSCYGPPDTDPHELAELTFYVSNDRTYNCQYVPIRFFWYDCSDNAISNVAGDSLILASRIYDFEGDLIWDEDDDDQFPDAARPPFMGVPDYCLIGDKLTPIRCMDVQNGGIDIVCSDSIDARGDINMNGVPYEVADAVMLTNYFISGLNAFGSHVEASIAASDINADGTSISVADLVYLVRVISGDCAPYPKQSPVSTFAATVRSADGEAIVDYESGVSAGAVLLVFTVDGSVGAPVLRAGAGDMDMIYGANGNELRVLVYDIGPGSIPAGEGELVAVPIDGSIELTEIEASDYYGNLMNVTTRSLPDDFVLEQNRPNPFNPETDISLRLPTASEWSVTIYNVAGQVIREYSGHSEAGTVVVTWDGADDNGRQVSSGIYLYKATAGIYSATRKMVMMK